MLIDMDFDTILELEAALIEAAAAASKEGEGWARMASSQEMPERRRTEEHLAENCRERAERYCKALSGLLRAKREAPLSVGADREANGFVHENHDYYTTTGGILQEGDGNVEH